MERSAPETRPRADFVRLWLVPLALYSALFVAFTGSILGRFSTHYFADDGDGLQNVWNLWWIDYAVTHLHTSPWATRHLHFPGGTSLLGQTLNPFNGFLGILLQPGLGLVRTHNAIVVFAFVGGAITAFRLALHVTARWPASLVAGFLFSFSSYHFAHAIGHLQLVSLEWIPLFLLAWLRLLERPSVARGVLAALALFLVLLCDHYYFFYCVLAGGFVVLGEMARLRNPWLCLQPPLRAPLAAFVAVCLATSGALVAPLLWLASHDPLLGAHRAADFSADLLAFWIPGGNWRFHELTAPYWMRLPGLVPESNIHLGLGTTLALALAVWQRRRFPALRLGIWWAILAFFSVMSLGPVLRIWGLPYPVSLPYRLLELVFPPIELSGCPARMVVMTTLAAGILAGLGLDEALRRGGAARGLAAALLLVIPLELLPKPIPTTPAGPMPGWVPVLAGLDDRYGFLDTDRSEASSPSALHDQTVHRIPLVDGYVSRLPTSVFRRSQAMAELARRREWRTLCTEHGVAYFLLRRGRGEGELPVAPVWREGRTALYDVRAAWECAAPTPR